jgi:8-oxo-dGTP diphosphatase
MGVAQSERLVLRRLRDDDASEIVRLVTDEEVAKQTAFLPTSYGEQEAQEWIRSTSKSRLILAIEDRRTGLLLGAISIHVRGFARWRVGTLGYWLGRAYWSRGYGNEAVQLFVPYCREVFGLSRFEARVFANNKASSQVLRKNGFKKIRSKRIFVPERGGWRVVETYRLRTA